MAIAAALNPRKANPNGRCLARGACRKARLGIPTSFLHRTATARAKWVSEGLRQSESGAPSTPDQIARLASARTAYEELAEVYEGMRRMVERGYVTLR